MKTSGQVLRDAITLLREQNAKRDQSGDEQLSPVQVDEICAQAVITEFLARSAEPIGKVLSESEMGTFYDRKKGDVIWWKKPAGPALLFLAPQPLSSVEEIYEAMDEADEGITPEHDKMIMANAVMALLKGGDAIGRR